MTGGVTDGTYTLELRDFEGTLVRTIKRFEEWRAADTRDRVPFVQALRQDSKDRLIVAMGIPSPGSTPMIPGQSREDMGAWDRRYDTLIEVYRASDGEPLTRTTLDPYVIQFVDDQTVYSLDLDDVTSSVLLNLWHLRLDDATAAER